MNDPWFDVIWAWVPGTVLGVATGVWGTFAGVLAPRGRAERPLTATFAILIAVSAAMLVAGAVALAAGQPYGVWYALGFPGLLVLLILGLNYPVLRRRFRDAEEHGKAGHGL